MIFGYARVSTKNQIEDRQEEKLKQANCEEIIVEKYSAKNVKDREKLNNLLDFRLRQGDTLIVTSLDRLSRNVKDTILIYEKLEEKKVNFLVLNNQMLNLKFIKKNNEYIADKSSFNIVILSVMSSLAQVERENMLERQREAYSVMKTDKYNRKISKKTGKVLGKKSMTKREDIEKLGKIDKDLIKKYLNKEVKYKDIKNNLTFKKTTFYEIIKVIKKENIEL